MRKTLLIILFCSVTFVVFSQQLSFKSFSLKEGLPTAQIFDIMQDSKGYLWLATLNGAAKFDGFKFQVFTKNDGLCSNRIRRIFEDSQHNIWFASYDQGVTKYDGKVFVNFNDTLGRIKNRGTGVIEDHSGRIWITSSNGISFIDKNGKIEDFQSTLNKELFNSISGSCVSKDGKIWFSSIKNGLIVIDPKTQTQKNITTADGLGNNTAYCVYEDKAGVIWVGHYGGFSSYNGKILKQYKIPGDDNLNRVNNIVEDSDGNLWLALDGNGFAIWSKKKCTVVNSKNGLSNDFIMKVIIDKEGNKWLASDGNGLIKFKDFSLACYTSNEGFPVNDVQSIQKDTKGKLWFSFLKGGIGYFQDDKFVNYSSKDGLLSDFAYHISIDSENNKWISTNKGLCFYDNKVFKSFTTKNGLLENLTYTSYFDKESKNILIGNESGFSLFDGKAFRNIRIPNNLSSASSIRTIIKDNMGIFWIGTVEGLMTFDGDSIQAVNELLPPDHLTYLSSAKDKMGNVWIAGASELIFISYVNKKRVVKVYNLSERFGIYGIGAILIDDETMWIGTENKIGKLNLKALRDKDVVNFELVLNEEYLPSAAINSGAIIKDDFGDIWFGSTNGAYRYSPSKALSDRISPRTYITGIRLFAEKFDYSNYSDSIDALTNLPINLVLPSNQNHLTFDFIGLYFSSPDKVKYKYRLKGFEEKWNPAISERKVTYSFLEPAEYTFQLIASNDKGVWNATPVEFSFSIKIPFWKSWWIPQMFILFYLIVLSLFFYYRFKKIKFQKAKQQHFTQQLINSQETERKRIAKELHDSVGQNLLIVKNKLLLDNKNNENSSFNIEQTAVFIEESIEEIRSICRDLHPYQLERFGLIKAIQLLIKKVSDVTSIYISDDIDIGVINFTAVQEIQLYRIVQESLNNIIKHSSATAAKISIHKKKDNILSIVIQDNGKGFRKEVLLSLNKNFGLVGIEERTNLLNGTFYIESDSTNGTKYFIDIPI